MTKHGVVKKESDHNVLITEFTNALPDNEHRTKVEIYNLKNSQCQKNFKEYTTNTRMLSSVFDAEEDLDILTQRF